MTTPKTQSEAEEEKKEQDHPGKVPGEGSGPTEAKPGETNISGGDTGTSDTADTSTGGNETAP